MLTLLEKVKTVEWWESQTYQSKEEVIACVATLGRDEDKSRHKGETNEVRLKSGIIRKQQRPSSVRYWSRWLKMAEASKDDQRREMKPVRKESERW